MATLEQLVQRQKEKIRDLEKAFNSLKKAVGNMGDGINTMSGNIASMGSSIDDHKKAVDGYHNGMNQQFENQNNIFAKGLEKLSSVLEAGFKVIDVYEKKFETFRNEFKKELLEDLGNFKDSNSRLLTNVSTGIAITELLKSSFVSDESETAIERSVVEHRERYDQVRIAVEEKKQLFDKHIENVFTSFFKQFQQIANHIMEIQYNIFQKLHTKGIIDRSAMEHIKQADDMRTELRQEKFDEISSNMNDESFANFSALRRKIETELSSHNILHVFAQQGTDSVPTLSLPVTFCETNKWDKSEERFVEIFGLNKETTDCYNHLETKKEFERYNSYVSTIPQKQYETTDMDKSILAEIKQGLAELHKANYLKDEHYKLIKTHLDLYSLDNIELRS